MYINKEISPAKGIASERCNAVSIVAPFDNPTAGILVMNTKICKACGKAKPTSEFYDRGTCYSSRCKMCHNLETVDNVRKKKGLIMASYRDQKQRSKKYSYISVSYTQKELIDWCMDQSIYHVLHLNWVKSEYLKNMKPSIDRISDHGPYSFNNIQLMTWGENKAKHYYDRKAGKSNHLNKAVVQICNSEIINEYYSASQAGRDTGIKRYNIIRCCNNVRKTAGGFEWKYKN